MYIVLPYIKKISNSVGRNDNFLSMARKFSIPPTSLDIFDMYVHVRQHYLPILYIHCKDDEFHAFFQCFQFQEAKTVFLYSWYRGYQTIESFSRLLNTKYEFIIINLAVDACKIIKIKDDSYGNSKHLFC